MQKCMDRLGDLDWTLVRSFLAVLEEGSLSAAARRLDVTQPTIGRHIRELETTVGSELFRRAPRGLQPTQFATALRPAAEAMQAGAAALRLAADARDDRLTGSVRITASQTIALEVLPELLVDLRAKEPGISVVVVATDETQNLLFREADIAVRMFRPSDPDVVTQHICDLPIGLFAHRRLLAGRVPPRTPEDLMALPLVGRDAARDVIDGFKAFGVAVSPDDFVLRCDDNLTSAALIRAGCGVGAMMSYLGNRSADLVPILPDLPIPPLEVWLAAVDAIHRNPRIRRVYDILAHELRARLHVAASDAGSP
jgi:DNA-binding transcriptional LysR family regulator